MAELERLANHLGDIGAICNDAAFALMHAHCGVLRERVLRAADACFGHRLMMDRIVPGGVAADLDAPTGAAAIEALSRETRASAFPRSSSSTTTPPRCRTAPSAPASSRRSWRAQFGAGGFVGRASGRAFDARRAPRLSALRRARVRGAGAERRRCQRARLDPHPRGRAEPRADRPDPRRACRTGPIRVDVPCAREPARAWRWSRAFAATSWSGCGSTRTARRALPSARSVLVPVAAARSRDRRQHRRRLPALQQIVQLLLFRATISDVPCADCCFEGLVRSPADRARARADDAKLARAGGARSTRAARQRLGPQPLHPRRSTPAPATAASWKSTRSTTPSTISSASACASSPRRAMPTCCWSPAR